MFNVILRIFALKLCAATATHGLKIFRNVKKNEENHIRTIHKFNHNAKLKLIIYVFTGTKPFFTVTACRSWLIRIF